MKNKHSRLGGSVIHRRLKCPGSYRECENLESKTSVYAQEGTAAHKLGEVCLLKKMLPSESVGKSITNEDGSVFEVTEEMADAVALYVKGVLIAYEEAQPGADLLIERKFSFDWLLPGFDMRGTNDAIIIQKYGVMKVCDYKHGQGVLVSAEDNDQLRYYALAALWNSETKNLRIQDRIVCEIWQPRAPTEDYFTSAEYKPEELMAWGRDVLVPGVKKCLEPDAPLKTGSWCQFCPAMELDGELRIVCPQARKENNTMVTEAFESPFEDGALTFPGAEELSLERLGKIVSQANKIKTWLDALVKNAKTKVMSGELKIPGVKLVRSRRTRVWNDETEVKKELSKFYASKIYKPIQLLTPRQMEMMIKKDGDGAVERIEKFLTYNQGYTLADESDKRPEYLPGNEFDTEPVE